MKQQPSARHCFVCGVENESGLHMVFFESHEEPPVITSEVTIPKRFQGYPGVVHGGIIATLLDETISRTIYRGDPPRMVVTARLSIRYRRPVPVETPIHVSGWVVEDRGKVIRVEGSIRDAGGVLLAEAEAVLTEVDPANLIDLKNTDESWQVYPID